MSHGEIHAPAFLTFADGKKQCIHCGTMVDDESKHGRWRWSKEGWAVHCGPFDDVPFIARPGAIATITGII